MPGPPWCLSTGTLMKTSHSLARRCHLNFFQAFRLRILLIHIVFFQIGLVGCAVAADHNRALFPSGIRDSAALVSQIPAAAGGIEDIDLFCSGLLAAAHDPGNQLRIRICSGFHRTVPADIRLHKNGLSLFHELFHAAEFTDGLIEHLLRLSAADRNQIHRTGFLRCGSRSFHRSGNFRNHSERGESRRRFQKITSVHHSRSPFCSSSL